MSVSPNRWPRSAWAGRPLVARFVLSGLTIGAVLGGLAGAGIGFLAYWRTAFFAAVELGVPSAVAGAVVGLVVGCGAWVLRRSSALRG